MPVSHAKSITVADATGTATGWFGTTTVTVPASAIQLPSDWNSAHNIVYNLAGNTAGSSSVSGTDVVLAASGNITLSATNGSLLFSAGVPSDFTANEWRPLESGNNSTFSSVGQNSVYILPLRPDVNVSFTGILFPASISFVSSSNSQSVVYTLDYGLYSRGTGTASTTRSLMSSSRIVMTGSYSSNGTAGFTISQGAGSFTTTSNGTAFYTNLSGAKFFYMPFTATLNAGTDYAFGFRVSSTNAVNTGPLRMALLHMTMINNTQFGLLNPTTMQGSAATQRAAFDMGIFSATSGTLPSTYADSQLTAAISRMRAFIQFQG
jgi:hypothetical protein